MIRKFILGTKQNMTQYFDENGVVHPATLIVAGPVVVTQVKTKEVDGYESVQVGFGAHKESRRTKPEIGHTKDLGIFTSLSEFRDVENKELKRGDTITVETFAPGDIVAVSGTSKGKGFQGVVKRHGFGGGRRSHGQKHSEREAGSIGGGGRAGGRVAKGMRMAGRMGGDRITVKNLTVLAISPETNEILIQGAIPGRRGTLIEIRA
jgi:large subunit ribosomal protein L3